MRAPIYQLDVFARGPWAGNPAAVCLLAGWPEDRVLQFIAQQNNLSETAFCVPAGDGYHLRWFTPTTEVRLCGHATIATAWVLFQALELSQESVTFETLSGPLHAFLDGSMVRARLPIWSSEAIETDPRLSAALGCEIQQACTAGEDLLLRLGDPDSVRSLTPDLTVFAALEARGVIVTAAGGEGDFVSRFFAPRVGVDEDPATGSAHCALAPYWADELGKRELLGYQLSSRGGEIHCRLLETQVELGGYCKPYLSGTIEV